MLQMWHFLLLLLLRIHSLLFPHFEPNRYIPHFSDQSCNIAVNLIVNTDILLLLLCPIPYQSPILRTSLSFSSLLLFFRILLKLNLDLFLHNPFLYLYLYRNNILKYQNYGVNPKILSYNQLLRSKHSNFELWNYNRCDHKLLQIPLYTCMCLTHCQ